MSSEQQTNYYNTGSNEKRKLPFIFRFRGIVSEVFVGFVLSTGAPWWIPWLLGLELETAKAVYCTIVTIVMTVFAIAVTLYTRSKVLMARGIQIKNREEIEREVNDNERAIAVLATSLRTRCQSIDSAMSYIVPNEGLEAYLNSLCNDVALCFGQITGRGSSIACSMRISDPDRDGTYITKGRSAGLSASRRASSTPVTSESGIYRALTRSGANCNDVILVKDVSEAVKEGQITEDENMRLYPKEIQSMIVARLNVQESSGTSSREALWGILYVSSSEKDAFANGDCLYLQVVANLISTTLWVVSERRNRALKGVECEGESIKASKKTTRKKLSGKNRSRGKSRRKMS